MAIVDLDTDTVTHTVPVGSTPVCSVIHEEANVGFISNMGDGSVSAIDLGTGTLITTIDDVGQSSTCMAIDTAQNLLLVTNDGGDVALISLDSIIGTAASTEPQGKRSTVWGWVKRPS
jgi:DNA-binding beta-propeller fold protein YncE